MEREIGAIKDLRVSGVLTFQTQSGPITLEITNARVISGAHMHTPEMLSTTKAIFHRLGEFLQSLPEGNTTDNWVRERAQNIQELGDESLMGAIPANIGRSTRFLSRFFHSLGRANIRTREDLINLSDRQLSLIKDAGAQSFRFGKVLREALKAEKLLKQTSNLQ